jgi:divalent metal cation (Fe/Co/Zn/Cd) transporter
MFIAVSEWVMDRIKEPSSWAAGAAVLVGLAIFLGQPWVSAAAIVAAIIAFVVKERGGSL